LLIIFITLDIIKDNAEKFYGQAGDLDNGDALAVFCRIADDYFELFYSDIVANYITHFDNEREMRGIMKKRFKELGGELPEDIGDKLPHLIYLSIEGERNTHAALPLHGSLPSSIGGMIDLKFLSILGDFNGSIPEAFANLGQLETLNLHANQLSGDAGVLSELSTLQYLNLGDNNFTSVPDLSHMSSLKTLILSGIPLKTFPLWLKKMTSLEKLNLEQCNIQGIIPKWIGDLVNLESLKLQGNKLFGNVPVTILNLTQIPNFRGQFDLYTNCDLYADNQDVKDFIQEKSCDEIEDQFFLCQSENTHADYDRLINSNTHKCDLGFSAIRMFLLD
jgi:hypothetical protein